MPRTSPAGRGSRIIASPEGILAIDQEDGKLDALSFMAHGGVGGMQLGKDGLGWTNVDLFKQLDGCIKGAIVFYSCQVGGEQAARGLSYELTIGNAVANHAKCKVLTCKMNQLFSWNDSTKKIDFGEFEGVVYQYAPGASPKMLNYSEKSKVNIESIVFS